MLRFSEIMFKLGGGRAGMGGGGFGNLNSTTTYIFVFVQFCPGCPGKELFWWLLFNLDIYFDIWCYRTVTVFSSFVFKDCCVQGKFAFVFLKWGDTNKMGGMTFCMKYIIRVVLINGNGYAKFPKNGVYPHPLQLGTWE